MMKCHRKNQMDTRCNQRTSFNYANVNITYNKQCYRKIVETVVYTHLLSFFLIFYKNCLLIKLYKYTSTTFKTYTYLCLIITEVMKLTRYHTQVYKME